VDKAHPEFHQVKIAVAKPYTVNERLFDAAIRVERKVIDRPAKESSLLFSIT
jgi:hypothetical protein